MARRIVSVLIYNREKKIERKKMTRVSGKVVDKCEYNYVFVIYTYSYIYLENQNEKGLWFTWENRRLKIFTYIQYMHNNRKNEGLFDKGFIQRGM